MNTSANAQRDSIWHRQLYSPSNLIITTIILWSAFLTDDLFLFASWAVVEIVLFVWDLCFGPYLPLDHIANGEPATWRRQALMFVSLSGGILILFVILGTHEFNNRFPEFQHSEAWEVVALSWTGIFVIYYYFKFLDTHKQHVNRVIGLLALSVGGFALAALYSLRSPMYHTAFVMAVSLCLLSADYLSWKYQDNPNEKRVALQSIVLADIPTVFAFLVLILYLLRHRDVTEAGVFISGAITFQLLVSNWIFVLIEAGMLGSLFPAGGEKAGEVPPI